MAAVCAATPRRYESTAEALHTTLHALMAWVGGRGRCGLRETLSVWYTWVGSA